MDFTEACDFTMPLGKHKGERLARIGSNDEGLRYLDWLIGQDWANGRLKEALGIYLKHPAVSRQLDAALEDE
jgi:uncharacterized protein (DUF3820 family)